MINISLPCFFSMGPFDLFAMLHWRTTFRRLYNNSQIIPSHSLCFSFSLSFMDICTTWRHCWLIIALYHRCKNSILNSQKGCHWPLLNKVNIHVITYISIGKTMECIDNVFVFFFLFFNELTDDAKFLIDIFSFFLFHSFPFFALYH